MDCSTQHVYSVHITFYSHHVITGTTDFIHILHMAPRSKRRRHQLKVLESLKRAIDGRFYVETPNAGVRDVIEDDVSPPSDRCQEIDIDCDSDSDVGIRIDGNVWRYLPDCADGFDDDSQDDIELQCDLNNSDISVSLLTSIEETEKRWRSTGHNCGRRDCGTSRSTFYRKKEKKAEDKMEDRHLPKIGSFFKAQPRRPVYDTDEESNYCQFILGEVASKTTVRKKYDVEEAMQSLRPLITDSRDATNASNLLLPWEITRARAVYKYYCLLINGTNKMGSSGTVVLFFYPHSTKKRKKEWYFRKQINLTKQGVSDIGQTST